MGDSFGVSLHELPTGTRHFEQALRVDRPPSALGFATQGSLPATQGKLWTDLGTGGGTQALFRRQLILKATADYLNQWNTCPSRNL